MPFLGVAIKIAHAQPCPGQSVPLVANSPYLGQYQCSAQHPGILAHPAIPPPCHGTACEVLLLRHSECAPHKPRGLILLDINKHGLQLRMSLQHDLKQGMQL